MDTEGYVSRSGCVQEFGILDVFMLHTGDLNKVLTELSSGCIFKDYLTRLFLFMSCRKNLLYLQIGFKSLSYEEQKQKPAYGSTSLFGMFCILHYMPIIYFVIKYSSV